MPEAAQKTVIWLASYPKSGNTWIRFLACNLVVGPIDSAAALNHLAPDVHELGPHPEPPRQTVFFKTHFLSSAALPLGRHSMAAIYVVRDPADVMVSNYHYALRRGAVPDQTPDSFSKYVDSYIASGGDPRWIELGMGTWQDNVLSWRAFGERLPLLWVRYEDLQGKPAAVAASLCTFLGLKRSAQEIERAVEGASFERMRAIEETDIATQRVGIFYKPHLAGRIGTGVRFMRHGKSGEAKGLLSDQQWERFNQRFGMLRTSLGYA